MTSTQVISPAKLAHVVVRTLDVAPMAEYYKKFLGATIQFQNERAAFLGYDEEHHRIGIVKYDNLVKPETATTGLEHIAFTFSNLNDLFTAYEQRKAIGILPVECMHHGPTISLYYEDPDRNKIETQVDTFDSPEDAMAFVMSQDYQDNPVGVDFDPEEMLRRVQSGESDASLKKRKVIGKRSFPLELHL